MRHSRLAKIMMLMGGGGEAASPLLTGLVSYYKMDETTGNREDSHGSNDLTVSGTVGYDVGKLGNAASIINPSYLYKAVAIQPSVTTGFTVWGWVNLAADVRSLFVMGHDSRWFMGYYGSGNHRLYISAATTSQTAQISQAISTGAWYFYCGRLNPATLIPELRINNSAWTPATGAIVGAPIACSQIRIANSTDGNCLVDSVGISGRYLSDAEVDSLYNSGNGLEYPF